MDFLASIENEIIAKLMFCGILDRLHADMNTENNPLVKEALWGASNIAAHSSEYVKQMTENAVFDKII